MASIVVTWWMVAFLHCGIKHEHDMIVPSPKACCSYFRYNFIPIFFLEHCYHIYAMPYDFWGMLMMAYLSVFMVLVTPLFLHPG